MLASELVEELEGLIEKHGDCIVTMGASQREIGEVRGLDIFGDLDGHVVEFSLAATCWTGGNDEESS